MNIKATLDRVFSNTPLQAAHNWQQTFEPTLNTRTTAMIKDASAFCTVLESLHKDVIALNCSLDDGVGTVPDVLTMPLLMWFADSPAGGACPVADSRDQRMVGVAVKGESDASAEHEMRHTLHEEVLQPNEQWLCAFCAIRALLYYAAAAAILVGKCFAASSIAASPALPPIGICSVDRNTDTGAEAEAAQDAAQQAAVYYAIFVEHLYEGRSHYSSHFMELPCCCAAMSLEVLEKGTIGLFKRHVADKMKRGQQLPPPVVTKAWTFIPRNGKVVGGLELQTASTSCSLAALVVQSCRYTCS